MRVQPAPFDDHLPQPSDDLLAYLPPKRTENEVNETILYQMQSELLRLMHTVSEMPTEEIEGLRSEAKECQQAISKSLHHNPMVYIYAAIISVCNIELEHRGVPLGSG